MRLPVSPKPSTTTSVALEMWEQIENVCIQLEVPKKEKKKEREKQASKQHLR